MQATGIEGSGIFQAIIRFKGAGKRLQLLGQKGNTSIFLDFAHSPSKVEATVKAVKEQFPRPEAGRLPGASYLQFPEQDFSGALQAYP